MFLALKVVLAVAAAVFLYTIAIRLIRGFMTEPPPSEPDPSTLRKVNYRYQCSVCGAEVTMTTASGDEQPEPPRHCREDMLLVADIDNN